MCTISEIREILKTRSLIYYKKSRIVTSLYLGLVVKLTDLKFQVLHKINIY